MKFLKTLSIFAFCKFAAASTPGAPTCAWAIEQCQYLLADAKTAAANAEYPVCTNVDNQLQSNYDGFLECLKSEATQSACAGSYSMPQLLLTSLLDADHVIYKSQCVDACRYECEKLASLWDWHMKKNACTSKLKSCVDELPYGFWDAVRGNYCAWEDKAKWTYDCLFSIDTYADCYQYDTYNAYLKNEASRYECELDECCDQVYSHVVSLTSPLKRSCEEQVLHCAIGNIAEAYYDEFEKLEHTDLCGKVEVSKAYGKWDYMECLYNRLSDLKCKSNPTKRTEVVTSLAYYEYGLFKGNCPSSCESSCESYTDQMEYVLTATNATCAMQLASCYRYIPDITKVEFDDSEFKTCEDYEKAERWGLLDALECAAGKYSLEVCEDNPHFYKLTQTTWNRVCPYNCPSCERLKVIRSKTYTGEATTGYTTCEEHVRNVCDKKFDWEKALDESAGYEDICAEAATFETYGFYAYVDCTRTEATIDICSAEEGIVATRKLEWHAYKDIECPTACETECKTYKEGYMNVFEPLEAVVTPNPTIDTEDETPATQSAAIQAGTSVAVLAIAISLFQWM